MNELFELQVKIVLGSLPYISQCGWCMKALYKASEEMDINLLDVKKAFKDQPYAALKIYNRYVLDSIHEQALEDSGFLEAGTTGKVKYLILLKFKLMTPYKGVATATRKFFQTPVNFPHFLPFTWETVDKIWTIADDTSLDFNYYTKRGILLGVYTSTLDYWLKTNDPDLDLTKIFLENRLEDSHKIAKAKQGILNTLAPITDCWKNLKDRF